MEFNLRPQWRLSNFRSQRPVCGKCGIGHSRLCFATFKNCYKCGEKGHYARMCNIHKPSVEVKGHQKFNDIKVKSKKRADRDRSRFNEHFDRKRQMFELPFTNTRNTAFVSALDTTNSVKVELKRIKEKLKEKNINSGKFKFQHTCSKKDEEISDLKEELNSIKTSLDSHVIQIKELQEELEKFKATPEDLDMFNLHWRNEFLKSENLRIMEACNKERRQHHLVKCKFDEDYEEIVANHPKYVNLAFDYEQLQRTVGQQYTESLKNWKEEIEQLKKKNEQQDLVIKRYQQQQQLQNQQKLIQQPQQWNQQPQHWNPQPQQWTQQQDEYHHGHFNHRRNNRHDRREHGGRF
ncbi:mRNA export factor GLE1-like [Mytilus edulis]|uniref:mRNA export factor GLE1-like n=1 Tax=Mytilus edulis TaxID=6550 RepID=UPI0039EF1A2F